MSRLNRKMICGKQGGTPFKDAVRPNQSNECPIDTVKCSKATKADDTICVAKKDRKKCPINYISIVEDNKKLKDHNYIGILLQDPDKEPGTLEREATKYVVFSKVGEGRPIINTQLSPALPCITGE
jgi:hypothetical protein